jgi:uracil-DNA glycosylase
LIIGQAPGSKVHQSGIPWSDLSGDRLRDWLKLDLSVFYDKTRVAILPIGFVIPAQEKAEAICRLARSALRFGTNDCSSTFPI